MTLLVLRTFAAGNCVSKEDVSKIGVTGDISVFEAED